MPAPEPAEGFVSDSSRRPPAVLFTAACQVLWGLIWGVRAVEFDGVLIRLLLLGIAASHLIAAYGLYRLMEASRQRAVQLSLFDVLGSVFALLSGHLTPLGAVFQLGMPLYTLTLLNDREVRAQFS